MKLATHSFLALLGATCLGIIVGVAFTQARANEQQPPGRATVVVGAPGQQAGGGSLNQPRAQQTPKPKLEVKPGDSEDIKMLKTEIKELRERVFKLEEKTSWRIRPASQP